MDAEKVVSLNPKEAKANLRKGIACFHLGDYEEASKAFHLYSDIAGNYYIFFLSYDV